MARTAGVQASPAAGIDPADLLRLVEALEKGAEVRGSLHQQADWQRGAQKRAAEILRGFVMAHTSGVPPCDGGDRMAAEKFELVRSIIHQCFALRMPQTFLQQLGMTAQIVPLKGLTLRQAEAIVDRLNAAPADGGKTDYARGYSEGVEDERAATRASLTERIDAAMVEMSNTHPPLRRSECERLIRAALGVSGVQPQQENDHG
jgi:hypothetical protein